LRPNSVIPSDVSRRTTGRVAIRFFAAAVLVAGVAGGVTLLLFVWRPPQPRDDLVLPAAFGATTLLLLVTSFWLHRAVQMVRRERQRPFCRSLLAALATGTLFVGIQVYGLLCLITGKHPGEAQTGARPFVFVFAAMHALHVFVALLFLVFVTVQARAGRYDHEYYWGPLVTGWFWHALGFVWLVLLGVMATGTLV